MSSFYTEALLCGGTAGMVANAITHPFDTAKAMIQYQVEKKSTRDVMEVLKNAWKSERFRPFYRGFVIVLVSTIPSTAVYFVSLETGKLFVPGPEESVIKQSISGVFAQFCSSFIFAPRDVIKERLQVQRLQQGRHYKGAWDAFKSIMKSDGVLGLYRGYWQTMTLWSVYGAMYLAFYTKTKTWAKKYTWYRETNMPAYIRMTCAIVSASLAAAITNPLDVIKLHFQVKPETKSFWDLAKNITLKYGTKVWLRGTLSRVLWMAPRTAISFTTYESVKNLLDRSKFKRLD